MTLAKDERPDLLIWDLVAREREPELTATVDADPPDPRVVLVHHPVDLAGHFDLVGFGRLGHSPALFVELPWGAA